MSENKFYQVNAAKVTHQLIDGEVIAIHFDTGNYYSMRDAAAHLWMLISQGTSTSSLLSLYKTAAPEMQAAVRVFFSQLESENLILPGSETGSTAASLENFTPQTPVLEKYDDMQQLLLADPVHEVDVATGWPNIQPSN